SDFLGSLPDPQAWRRDVLGRFEGIAADRLSPAWRAARRELLSATMDELRDTADRSARDLAACDCPRTMLDPVIGLANQFEIWHSRITSDPADADVDAVCADICAFEFPRAPVRSAKVRAL